VESSEDRNRVPPPFDTVANLRALGEVQRRGLEAANAVIGRLVERTDAATPGFSMPDFGAPPATDDPGDRGAGTDPLTQWVDLFQSGMTAMFEAMTGRSTNGSSMADRPDGVSTDPVTLPEVRAGDTAAGEIWLHNRSGSPVAAVRLHCGDLRTHDGWAVAADRVAFDPDEIDELPDRSSRGIDVSVAVPVDTPAGTYRGTILAANLPEVWLPVELVVRPAP
jgi:hypothetical protein